MGSIGFPSFAVCRLSVPSKDSKPPACVFRQNAVGVGVHGERAIHQSCPDNHGTQSRRLRLDVGDNVPGPYDREAYAAGKDLLAGLD